MEIKINPEFESLIPSLTQDEFERLEQSIIKEGCRDPLVLWNNTLIDGHNRKKICDKNNKEYNTISLEFKNEESVKEWVINNQLGRRNITGEQRTYLIGKLSIERKKKSNIIRKEYNKKESQIATNNDDNKKISEQIAEEQKVHRATVFRAEKYSNAIDVIADNVGDKIKQKILDREIKTTQEDIKEIAKLEPEQQKKVFEKIDKQKGKKELKKAKREVIQETKKKSLPKIELPKDEYNIIYADPPWKYDFSKSSNRDIENQYPTMTINELKQLKIPTTKNAVLYLWATAPKLEQALEIMKEWGFVYKTQAIWDKEIIGMGYWFRGQHEILLVGVKGKFSPPEPSNRISSVIREKRTKHSKKPNMIYKLLENMFPDQKYLELFARQKFNDNWEVWGNEL